MVTYVGFYFLVLVGAIYGILTTPMDLIDGIENSAAAATIAFLLIMLLHRAPELMKKHKEKKED